MQQVIRDHLIETRDWYRQEARPRRRLFRLLGTLVILISTSIPVLSPFEVLRFRLTVGILGALTACIVALNQFFRFEKAWTNFHLAELELDRLLRRWQL